MPIVSAFNHNFLRSSEQTKYFSTIECTIIDVCKILHRRNNDISTNHIELHSHFSRCKKTPLFHCAILTESLTQISSWFIEAVLPVTSRLICIFTFLYKDCLLRRNVGKLSMVHEHKKIEIFRSRILESECVVVKYISIKFVDANHIKVLMISKTSKQVSKLWKRNFLYITSSSSTG